MSRLDEISVEVVPAEQDAPPADIALPILSEITAMLEALIACGQTDSIDLRRAPLGPDDLVRLKDLLGTGEVSAQLDCLGLTRIRETAVSGVWWITHCNEDGKVQGEFIEVTICPEILVTSAEELHSGQRLLQARISQCSQVNDPSAIASSLQALGLCTSHIVHNDFKPDQPVKRSKGNGE